MKILIGDSIADTLREDLEASIPANEILEASLGRFPSTTAFAHPSNKDVNGNLVKDFNGEPMIVIQSTARVEDQTANDFAMELAFTIYRLKESGAGPIWVIEPFDGYARSDRADEDEMHSIGVKYAGKILKSAGAVGVSTVEIHSRTGLNSLKEVFNGNAYSIDPTELFPPSLAALNLYKPIVGGPDYGAHERAKTLAQLMGAGQFHVRKKHEKDEFSKTTLVSFEGDVAGHDAIILDDQIDTAGTMENCGKRLKEEGALRVIANATHLVGSKGGLERLLTSKTSGQLVFDQIVVTNTIDAEPEIQRLSRQYSNVRRRVSVISVGSLLKQHIREVIKSHPSMQFQLK